MGDKDAEHVVTISFTRSPQRVHALMALDALIAAPLDATVEDPGIGYLRDEWPSMFQWWIETLVDRLEERMPKSWSNAHVAFIEAIIAADKAYFGNEKRELSDKPDRDYVWVLVDEGRDGEVPPDERLSTIGAFSSVEKALDYLQYDILGSDVWAGVKWEIADSESYRGYTNDGGQFSLTKETIDPRGHYAPIEETKDS